MRAKFPKVAFGQVVGTLIAIDQCTDSFEPEAPGLSRDGVGSYETALPVGLMLQ